MKKIIFLAFLLLFTACDEKKEEQILENNKISITIKKGLQEKNIQDKYINYDINGEKSINFSLSENNETTKTLGALALRKKALQSINKTLLKGRLSKNFLQKCSACHNDYANGIIGPSLLTKSENEIYEMIKAYKTKLKKNVLMQELVAKMPDSEIKALAKEISDFNLEFRSKK